MTAKGFNYDLYKSQHTAKQPKREWVGLTQDEQDKVFKTFSKSDAYKRDFLNRIASAIEAKLKEKNV